MPMYRLFRFNQLDALSGIDPDCLRLLLSPHREYFARHGFSLPADGQPGQVNQRGLAPFLVAPRPDTPPELSEALFYIHEMATFDGMEKLLDRVPAANAGWFGGQTAIDVAVRAWLADQPAFERAHAELFATRPRRFRHFQALVRSGRPFVPPDAAVLRALERSLDEVFDRKHRGRGVRVFAFPHEHDCQFLVRHGDPYRREGTLDADGDETSSVLYRPLRFDVVGYNPRTATLRVHTDRVWKLSAYQNLFGRHLFGDFNHFPKLDRYTLEPLRALGEDALKCPEVPQIKRIELTSLQTLQLPSGWNPTTVTVAADNVFAALKSLRRKLCGAVTIVQATFRIHLYGDKVVRTLTIKPPNVADYGRDDDSLILDQWLAHRGFLKSNAEDTDGDGSLFLVGA